MEYYYALVLYSSHAHRIAGAEMLKHDSMAFFFFVFVIRGSLGKTSAITFCDKGEPCVSTSSRLPICEAGAIVRCPTFL